MSLSVTQYRVQSALRTRKYTPPYLESAETFSRRTTERVVATNLEINSALSETRFHAMPMRHNGSF